MATKTWTGGTGTWSTSNGASWSGGTVPANGDTIVFDGTSGGGTVSVDSSINGMSFTSITMGAFTGTVDFSVGNPNLTITSVLSVTGTATRGLNLGSGTFTYTSTNGTFADFTTISGLTLTASASTFFYNGAASVAAALQGGGASLGTLSVGAATSQGPLLITGGATFAGLSITGPRVVTIASGSTVTISNAFNITGSSSALTGIMSNSTIATAALVLGANSTISWTALRGLVVSGSTLTASSSFDLKGNSGTYTVTAPTGGTSGGGIIGS